jgi:uncharacterized protein YndB with AHSA1/START domain
VAAGARPAPITQKENNMSQSNTELTQAQVETPASEPEIILRRFLAAPRALVFKASTEPQHMLRWWGPHGYVNTHCEMDARPGGAWRVDQRGTDGTMHYFTGVFIEVKEPERLVLTQVWNGLEPGMHCTTILDERDGGTDLTTIVRMSSVAERDMLLQHGMTQGALESLERLAELLAELRAEPGVADVSA